MTIFLALIVFATAGAEPEDSGLEEAFRQGGAAGFLAAVRELEQEQGPEHTAKALVRLTSGRDGDRELRATAAHAIGQMPELTARRMKGSTLVSTLMPPALPQAAIGAP